MTDLPAVVETDLAIPGVRFVATGAVFDESLTWDGYCYFMGAAMALSVQIPYVIGDGIIEGERRWPDIYTQAIEITGRTPQTCYNYVSILRQFPHSRRIPGLSIGILDYARTIKHPDGSPDTERQDEFIRLAHSRGLNREEFRQLVREEVQGIEPELLPAVDPLGEAIGLTERMASIGKIPEAQSKQLKGWRQELVAVLKRVGHALENKDMELALRFIEKAIELVGGA